LAEIGQIQVSAYDVPTESQPESDGTAIWSKTTLVVVEVQAGAWRGLGCSRRALDGATRRRRIRFERREDVDQSR